LYATRLGAEGTGQWAGRVARPRL